MVRNNAEIRLACLMVQYPTNSAGVKIVRPFPPRVANRRDRVVHVCRDSPLSSHTTEQDVIYTGIGSEAALIDAIQPSVFSLESVIPI